MKNINDYLEQLIQWIFSEEGNLFFGVMTYVFAIVIGGIYTYLILFEGWWSVNIHKVWAIPTAILAIAGAVGLYKLVNHR